MSDYLDVDPDPDPVRDPHTLARHFHAIGDSRRSLSELDAAARADSSVTQRSEHWQLRAHALTDLERYDAANDAILRGLAIDPRDVELLLAAGTNRAWQGDVAGAERALLDALDQEPGSPGLLATYARVLLMTGHVSTARDLVDTALSIAPHDSFAHTVRLEIAHLSGDRTLRQMVDDTLRMDPRHRLALVLHGELRERRGDYETSAQVWSELAREDPSELDLATEARRRRGLLHWTMTPARFVQRWAWLTIVAYVASALVLRIFGVALLFVYLTFGPLWAERWMRWRAMRRRQRRRK